MMQPQFVTQAEFWRTHLSQGRSRVCVRTHTPVKWNHGQKKAWGKALPGCEPSRIGLFEFDLGALDDGGVAGGLSLDELGKLGFVQVERYVAEGRKFFFHLRAR